MSTISDISNYFARIAARIEGALQDRWAAAREDARERIAKQIEREAKAMVPVASGDLRNSITCEVVVDGWTWQIVFHAAKQWDYVSRGRKPGSWPPPDAIRQWIEVKRLQPYPDSRGRIPTLQQLTYLVSRKIFREGIAPKNYNNWLDQQAARYKVEIETIIKNRMQ